MTVSFDQKVTNTTPDTLRIVIAGGGTGGHLYPGIAVARELLARRAGTQISFAGTAQGIEARVLPRAGFALDLTRSGGLKRKSILGRRGGPVLCPGNRGGQRAGLHERG